MFTMMNNARLGVGVQGVGVGRGGLQEARRLSPASAAGQTPAASADHRPCRRAPDAGDDGAPRSSTARAICARLRASPSTWPRATGEADWAARAAFLTPIAKAFGTDTGCEVGRAGDAGHRRHGLYRGDRRGAVLPRRAGDGDLRGHQRHPGDGPGRAARWPMAARRPAGCSRRCRPAPRRRAAPCPILRGDVWSAAETLREATEWMIAQDMDDRFAGAVPYLRAFARVLGAHYHLRAAAGRGIGGRAPALAAASTSAGCCRRRRALWPRRAPGPRGCCGRSTRRDLAA